MPAASSRTGPRRIGIVGAGFAGTTLAVQLARRLNGRAEILLYDRAVNEGGTFGRGIAYATTNEHHLLNVPAGRMSALDAEPEHFLRWLERTGRPAQPGDFLPRGLYGAYLEQLLGETAGITRIAAEIRRIDTMGEGGGEGLVLRPTAGASQRVGQVVLCIGNFLPASPVERRIARSARQRYIANPWNAHGLDAIGADEAVVLIGSGLTMVDVALDLRARGHRGTLVTLSRHGLLPQAHRPADPLHTNPDWPEVSSSTLALLRHLRDAIAAEEAQGGDWRAVIDSLRPKTQALWRGLPIDERRRFMRHLKPYWEIHRHRLAPEIARDLESLEAANRLQVIAGRVREVNEGPAGLTVAVRERGRRGRRYIDAGWIVNCSGPALDYARSDDPLVRALLRAGQARPGPLSLGLDVDEAYGLIDTAGQASRRLFAIGPPIRGALWETTAVPEIRRQCAVLAERLAAAA